MSEKEIQRQHLYNIVDRIVDVPNGENIDQWANSVLADLPDILNAAMPAFDYEFGRILDGVSRPIYHYGGS